MEWRTSNHGLRERHAIGRDSAGQSNRHSGLGDGYSVRQRADLERATFTIIAPPTISSISPNAAVAGGPVFTLTVNGTNFDNSASVQWNGTGIPTSFGNSTQLSATVAASLIASPGTALVTVSDNGATSNSATFTIAPAPAIGSLNPTSATAGGPGFTLTVDGSGFASGATVQWNGTGLTTNFVSSSEIDGNRASHANFHSGKRYRYRAGRRGDF